jgi:uncharacterized membrane protein YdjX (TVP38/TMEM64 family)
MGHYSKKILIILLLAVAGVVVLKETNMGENVTLAGTQGKAAALRSHVEDHYVFSVLIFIGAYVIINLFIPVAAILTLLAGFLFNTLPAVLYVDAAGTLGALLGFWISRHIVGNWIQHKWHHQLDGFNKQVDEQGYIYLVFVRMIPLMPYNLVNFLAGLTKVPLRTLAWTTAVGSLPGILVFCYAGRQFLTITSVDDVLTARVIAAFSLLIVFAGSVMGIKLYLTKGKKTACEEKTAPQRA